MNIATPIVSGDKIFISSGYGRGCSLLSLEGDALEKVWENKEMNNHCQTCVLAGGFIYGVHGQQGQKGSLKCLDFETGKVKWDEKGLPVGGGLTLADGKLFVMLDGGTLLVAEASPKAFKELARAKVLDGQCWTMPVVANGRVYCRNHAGDLVCVDLRSTLRLRLATMSSFEDLSFSFQDFSGKVRLFPLPNLVLFPHVIPAAAGVRAAVPPAIGGRLGRRPADGDGRVGPGLGEGYEGRPPLSRRPAWPALLRTTAWTTVRTTCWCWGCGGCGSCGNYEPSRPYREAEVELCEDVYPPKEACRLPPLTARLRKALLRVLPTLPEAQEQMDKLLATDLPLGVLTDVLSYMLDMDIAAKQVLLGEALCTAGRSCSWRTWRPRPVPTAACAPPRSFPRASGANCFCWKVGCHAHACAGTPKDRPYGSHRSFMPCPRFLGGAAAA